MENRGTPAATRRDIPWLPPGSYVEVWLGDVPAPVELVTSAFALAFDDAGRLLLTTVIKRGLDIPGGHVEDYDAGPEATAVRETSEEAGGVIRIVGKAGHLRIVVPDPPPDYRYPPISYQPFYAAAVEGMGPVIMTHECSDPTFLEPEEAAAHPRFALHAELIMAASGMVRDQRPAMGR